MIADDSDDAPPAPLRRCRRRARRSRPSATAWRALAADGARYTTYLDQDGTYRDLRNGDPWQTGSWTYSKDEGDKLLCFTPDSENGAERCWRPERMNGDTMRARSGDTEIELTRVEYAPPGEGSEQAE